MLPFLICVLKTSLLYFQTPSTDSTKAYMTLMHLGLFYAISYSTGKLLLTNRGGLYICKSGFTLQDAI